jgi:hypothetical protein
MLAVAILAPIVAPFETLNYLAPQAPAAAAPSLARLRRDRDGRDVRHGHQRRPHLDGNGIFSTLIAGFLALLGSIAGYPAVRQRHARRRVLFTIPFLFRDPRRRAFFGQGRLLDHPRLRPRGRSSPAGARPFPLREADFVDAARAVGVSGTRITFRHILPNALGPVIVAMTLLTSSNIVLEAFVSFLNFGIKETDVSWGNALANAQNALSLGNWWWSFFPGMSIALTVISINFIGDGLHDALDPRTRE